ncbi:MAG: hypothetical protein Q9162_005122 [Coniocarpon cinnabarinum]
MSNPSADTYPVQRNYTESDRLRAQHTLFTTFIGFVLAPVDLKKHNLRVLDSGTSDGFWLASLAPQLGPNAELFGTDVAPYETKTQLPSNVTMSQQNIKDPWPEEWKGSFDLVHQRFVLSNIADHDAAKLAIRRLVELVKPGGWIQLDEASAIEGDGQPADTPIEKMFRVVGDFMRLAGMDPAPGARVKQLLEEASDGSLLEEPVHVKTADAQFGRPAPTKEVAEAGVANIMGILDAIKGSLSSLSNFPISADDLEKLRPACVEQLNGPGAQMPYVSVWAQRKAL